MKTETTILLLRDLDDRVDGEGLTWWVYLDPSVVSGQPYVGVTALDSAQQRGWWRIPYEFDPEHDAFATERPPSRRCVGYRRTREVEGYPERMTVGEYEATQDGDDEGDPLARVLYEPEYEDLPPVRETLDAPRVVLDGSVPPADGLNWQASLPLALRQRPEYEHLFPGNLLGYREAVAAALDEIDGVKAHARGGSPNVAVYLHVKLPRLERLEWQRKPFYPGMSREDRRKVNERLSQTYEVVTRTLEIPVVTQVGGRNRAEATTRWHDGIAELVAYVRSIVGHPCETCGGRGFLEGDGA